MKPTLPLPRSSATYKSIDAQVYHEWDEIGRVLSRHAIIAKTYIDFIDLNLHLDKIADLNYTLGYDQTYPIMALRKTAFNACIQEEGRIINKIIKNDGSDIGMIQHAAMFTEDVLLYAWKASKDVPKEVIGWRKMLYSFVLNYALPRASRALHEGDYDRAECFLLAIDNYASKAEGDMPAKVIKLFETLHNARRKPRKTNPLLRTFTPASFSSLDLLDCHSYLTPPAALKDLIAYTIYWRRNGLYGVARRGVCNIETFVSEGKLKKIPQAIAKIKQDMDKLKLEHRVLLPS